MNNLLLIDLALAAIFKNYLIPFTEGCGHDG